MPSIPGEPFLYNKGNKILVNPDLSNIYVLAVVLALVVPSAMGYMAWEARVIDITTLSLEGAPEGVVFISDPHLKEGNVEHVRSAIEKINALNPSVVLIGGDFCDGDESDFSLHEVWSEIDAPVYAVLGNHDYRTGTDGVKGMKKRIANTRADLAVDSYDVGCHRDANTDTVFADALCEELERNGVTVLRNEYVDISVGGKDLRIVGVDDGWAGMAAPPRVPPTDAYTIYLIHEPECRADWDADLTLSGHTHGGQFAIPLINLLNDYGIVELYGLHQKSDSPTYITRGICSSSLGGMELRFNSRPEIVIINPLQPVEATL